MLSNNEEFKKMHGNNYLKHVVVVEAHYTYVAFQRKTYKKFKKTMKRFALRCSEMEFWRLQGFGI